MKIYIVYGTSGEYSDRGIWCLGGFRDECKAKELVENASGEARRIYALIEEKEKSKPNIAYHMDDDEGRKELNIAWNAWMLDFANDPAMDSKYDKDIDTGIWQEARYYYEEVDLMDG